MQSFRDLKVWQKGHCLTLDIYKNTVGFPREDRYGLTSQPRRACSSVSANLAEGSCRGSDKDFARFVNIALGSASEVEYFLLLARDLHYLTESAYVALDEQVREVKRMLTGLKQRLMASCAD